MSMPIWVCLTRRRTSDILELTIKKNAAPSGGVFLWSWRRKELPVAVPPASEATSRGAEHSQLLPFLMLPTPSSTIKKDRSLAVIFLWSWRLHKTPLQFIVFQCLQPLKNLSSNKRETKLYLYRLSGCCFQLSKNGAKIHIFS